MRICLTVTGTLHVEYIEGFSLFKRCEWVTWVWPMRSLVSITTFLFFSSPATHLWYLEFGGACSQFDHPKIFCHLSSMKFLMISFHV